MAQADIPCSSSGWAEFQFRVDRAPDSGGPTAGSRWAKTESKLRIPVGRTESDLRIPGGPARVDLLTRVGRIFPTRLGLLFSTRLGRSLHLGGPCS